MGIMSAVDAGAPAPLAHNTQDDTGLPPPIPFTADAPAPVAAPLQGTNRSFATLLSAPVSPAADIDPFEIGDGPPALRMFARAIRPICIGALLAIPTLGPATVGLVAAVSEPVAMAMVRASIAFLNGIPGDVLLLIGALAGGYAVAKTVERKVK